MDETKKDAVSRGEFLKCLGTALGAAGLVAAIPGAASAAETAAKTRYLVVLTNGGNNPNRAILGLLMAVVAADKGFGEVQVWMTLEGAELAVKEKAERIDSPIFKSFGSASQLMEKLASKKVSIGVCPPCAEYAGAVGSAKYDFVEKRGADWLLKNMAGAEVVWM